MKQQKPTTFKINDAPAGILAAVCGIAWILSLLEIACGNLREALHAGSFGGVLNLYLEHRALYDAALHRVYAETGSFWLPAAVLFLAACFSGWCFFAALRRGGTSFSLTFAVFSIPVIALQLLLPTADARMPGLYLTCAGAAWLLGTFAGNQKKAILFFCLLLLTGAAADGLFAAAGGEQSLAELREEWSTKIETWRYGGAGSGMTFGSFRTDAAAERSAAAAKAAENAEAGADAAVLRVTMSEPQPYYLRGYTGDRYTKDGWERAAPSDIAENAENNALFYRLSEERFDSQTMLAAAQKAAGLQAGGNDAGNVIRVVNTGASRRYLYLPYEAERIEAKGTPLIGGGLRPEDGSARRYAVTARPYLIDRYGTILDALSASKSAEGTAYRQAESNYRGYVLRCDLELPETCRDAVAKTFPDAAGVCTSGEAKAAILETLSGMQYDESVTDSEEKDFAADFLTRKSGYDQHFTTAAVLAFRYYGIPARFAEGYLITADMTKDVKSGEEIAVTAAQAHCWVEYYEDGVGWLPFETTPPYIGLMKSAGSVRIAEQQETAPQPQQKPETDDKAQQTVTTESEVNYPMLAALLLLLLLLAAAAVRAVRRRQRGRQAGRKGRPRRRDITDADRRRAILALLYFIRRREEKAARRQKQGAPAETRAEIEAIYQEARYSAHPVREADYQKVLQFYRQMKKGRQRNVRNLSLLLCLLLFGTVFGGCGASSGQPYQKALDAVQDYLEKTVTDPVTGSVGGEWAVIALTRGGGKVSDTFLQSYLENTEAVVREAQGVLHTATGYKYTEYARILLGWTAAGGDPTDVGGYNFLEKLTDLNNVCRQGINGPIWALIAYDCGGYEIPDVRKASRTQPGGGAAAAAGRTAAAPVQTTREALLRYLLDNRTADGGWNLSGEEADVDLTAMALTAMAPYVCGDETLCREVTEETLTEVREAADRALSCLADKKLSDGGFESWGSVNAESCAQVLTALSSLGIDAAEDERFAGTLEALLAFQQEDGGFAHVADGGTNQMATEQAAYALAAYDRVKNGEPRLFDLR